MFDRESGMGISWMELVLRGPCGVLHHDKYGSGVEGGICI